MPFRLKQQEQASSRIHDLITPQARGNAAFTMVELMVAAALTLLILGILGATTNHVSKAWVRSDSQVTSFRSTRLAFERLNRTISQATLNPYWDYVDAAGTRRTATSPSNWTPSRYQRQSDQHFYIAPASSLGIELPNGVTQSCFFQAPIGYSNDSNLRPLNNLLNAVGFYVEFNSDLDYSLSKPSFVTGTPKYRYRLMQILQPSDLLGVYNAAVPNGWITSAMAEKRDYARPIADNIIALILQAKTSDTAPPLAPSYTYDSRDATNPRTFSQLPPIIEVTMVAIDEKSAARLAQASGTSAPDLYPENPFLGDAADFDTDLQRLRDKLQSQGVDYRIFTSSVRIDAAKWSD